MQYKGFEVKTGVIVVLVMAVILLVAGANVGDLIALAKDCGVVSAGP